MLIGLDEINGMLRATIQTAKYPNFKKKERQCIFNSVYKVYFFLNIIFYPIFVIILLLVIIMIFINTISSNLLIVLLYGNSYKYNF